jgi:hypothetical protein
MAICYLCVLFYMIQKKLELINELTSPLFRIMWIYNIEEPERRYFGNNICAFHIGNGNVLTVAHNLRTEAGIIFSIPEEIFSSQIQPKLNQDQLQFFNQQYFHDSKTNKRYLASRQNSHVTQRASEILKQINFDTRWITLNQNKFCKPFLIVQFRDKLFYGDEKLTNSFNRSTSFPEPSLNRHTFLIELELVKEFYGNDVALYKIINTDKEIINKLPGIKINFSILDLDKNLFCLQSSSNSLLGRLANKANIEGYADNWSLFKDHIGGDYVMEGIRYLIKGYFRFGSSGAPYIVYDENEKQFFANAIQSEASPIQLSINQSREGNYQYVNAIATPLNNLESELKKII